MQPRLPVREAHHVREPGEGQERRERLPLSVLQAEDRAAVVHLALVQRLDLARPPAAAARRGWPRVTRGAHQRVPDQPGDLVAGRVPGGQRAGAQRPAEPLGMVGPPVDLGIAQRLVVQAHRLPAGPVGVEELGEHAAGQLCAHAPLAEPHAQVDLLGPEVLGPHMPVHLVQVAAPAGTAVRGGVELRGPLRRRVGAVHDAQVHLGVRHPDRGQRHGDVGGQRFPVGRRDELIRLGGQPVVGPRVRLGQQDPVVEVAQGQPRAAPGPGTHVAAPCGRAGSTARAETSTPASAV